MLIHDCIPCQRGQHDSHCEVVESVPPGMFGGWRCGCKGDCAERYARTRPDHADPTADNPCPEPKAAGQ